MEESEETKARLEAMWRDVLTHGHGSSRLAFLPGFPRCATCHTPFGSIGGRMGRLLGRRPSRKSPNLCNHCDELMPPGGAEVDIAVLFADVRGSTGLGERMGPSAFATLLNRFYKAAHGALLANEAMIDKMIGDEVMALFIPGFCGPDPKYRVAAVRAAVDLMRSAGYGGRGEPWLPLGIGVHAGPAYVGKVGSEGVYDFTALGDTVNSAARLQAQAGPGEIVLSEAVYQAVADRFPNLEQKTVSLRGRDETIMIRVLKPATLSPAQLGR